MNTLKSNEVYENDNEIERKYSVYIHTTPSGKKYVGLTSTKPIKRWDNGRGYVQNSHFFNAILKYGWINIQHEIVYENLTEEEAKQKEIELIAFYKTTDRKYGYNVTIGGDTVSSNIKKKIYMYDKDTGEYLRSFPSANDAERYLGKNGNDLGKHCDPDDFHTAYGYLWRYEFVPRVIIVDKHSLMYLFDSLSLNFIDKYKSKDGVYYYENQAYQRYKIVGKCSNKNYLYKSIYCCYDYNLEDLFFRYLKDGFHYRAVFQIDENNNSIIGMFRNYMDVQYKIGYTGSAVGNVCLHKQKTAYGYKWDSVGIYGHSNFKGDLPKINNLLNKYEDKCGLTRIANILSGKELPEIPNI